MHTLVGGLSTIHGLIRANPCCGPSFQGPKFALTTHMHNFAKLV